MPKGKVYPPEGHAFHDQRTGAKMRQVTSHQSIHRHPFFLVPAYDDAMQHLVFLSWRTGRPQIFAENRQNGCLLQLTDQDDVDPGSVYPSHDGRFVYFTAGAGAWRVHTQTLQAEQLVDFRGKPVRQKGALAVAAGTTALSACDGWWAISVRVGPVCHLVVIDAATGKQDVILERDTIAHPEFCSDDSELIRYSGPLTDRVWVVGRDGSSNRRVYQRRQGQWITHESWLPRRREVAFVDWPNGIRCVQVDTLVQRRAASFNAWHAVSNRQGTLMVADANFPDIGLQIFSPPDGIGRPRTLCLSQASSIGEHWRGAFPYEAGPIEVHAPQHTHPHPSFSPDATRVCFTADRTGCAQIYEVELPEEMLGKSTSAGGMGAGDEGSLNGSNRCFR